MLIKDLSQNKEVFIRFIPLSQQTSWDAKQKFANAEWKKKYIYLYIYI